MTSKDKHRLVFLKGTDRTHKLDMVSVSVSTDSQDLDEVLAQIRNFLRACGFAIDGDLVVKENIPPDDSDPEDSSGHA